ncbi:MAG: hypothetical protein HXX16_02560 [Bacteroidales bacterium]|nr:hypothetical protein [Bacteroidales bacterium]
MTKELIDNEVIVDDIERLVLIGTDSVRMIAFISAIEEEWEIEIPDEMISYEFFTSYDFILKCINDLKS